MKKYSLDMTVREVISDTRARELVERYLPGITTHPMIGMAKSMTLRNVIGMSKGKIDQDTIDNFTKDLEELNV